MRETRPNPTKSNLSKPKAQLVELMQRLNYGYLEGLTVRNGEPIFDPPPRVVRQVRFCRENRPRQEIGKSDFILKAEVRDLFAHMEAMGDGVIECLEIQRGLPFKMTIEEDAV